MKHLNLRKTLYTCRIDYVTDTIVPYRVTQLRAIHVGPNITIADITTDDNRDSSTPITNLYNSRAEAQKVCTQYNTMLWKQD